jgi:hypothetical protein
MIFRLVLVISCVGFLLLAFQLVIAFVDMREPLQPVFALFLCLETFFLFRQKRYAIVTATALWAFIVVLSVGGALLNPFFWGDMNFRIDAKNWVVPVAFFLIATCGAFCVWGLNRGIQPTSQQEELSGKSRV